MSDHAGEFLVRIEQVSAYELRVVLDDPRWAPLALDEPPPLGHGAAPGPARMLAAAIGGCLSASLVFCMKRHGGVDLEGLGAEVKVRFVRNERKRQRIGGVDVVLRPRVAADDAALAACRDAFEDFCTVTESVRRGIPVTVTVEPTG